MILYSYPKYTIQKFILLIVLLICVANLSVAQSAIKFELNDSIEINKNDLGLGIDQYLIGLLKCC